MSALSNSEHRYTVSGTGTGLDFLEIVGRTAASHARFPLCEHDHGDAFEICYLKRGTQMFSVADEDHIIQGGDFFVTYPGERHGTGHEPMEKSVLYWIIIRPGAQWNAPTALQDTIGLIGEVLLKIRARGTRAVQGPFRVANHFDELLAMWDSGSGIREIAIVNLVLSIVLELYRADTTDSDRQLSPGIARVVKETNLHPADRLSVEQMAEMAGLSESHFRSRFEAETGIPPAEYATRIRIEEAKRRLGTGARVTDVAFDLGFGSTQYFATVFKRFTAIKPSQYRLESRTDAR